jgi:hypothetical protein
MWMGEEFVSSHTRRNGVVPLLCHFCTRRLESRLCDRWRLVSRHSCVMHPYLAIGETCDRLKVLL